MKRFCVKFMATGEDVFSDEKADHKSVRGLRLIRSRFMEISRKDKRRFEDGSGGAQKMRDTVVENR